MPFLEGQQCVCDYTYPSWVQTPQRAYERAQRLAAEGLFDVYAGVDTDTVDRTELVFDSLASTFHYAGLKFSKL